MKRMAIELNKFDLVGSAGWLPYELKQNNPLQCIPRPKQDIFCLN